MSKILEAYSNGKEAEIVKLWADNKIAQKAADPKQVMSCHPADGTGSGCQLTEQLCPKEKTCRALSQMALEAGLPLRNGAKGLKSTRFQAMKNSAKESAKFLSREALSICLASL